MSRSQLRLWFMDQFDPGNAVYNILSCVRLTGDLSPQFFERSFKAILDRHESLRTDFHQRDGIPFARVMAAEDWRMSFVDFSDLPLSQRDTAVILHLEEEARRPFSLEDSPLFRATLLRTGPQDHIVLLVVHHIVFDGWSMGVLSQELMALYEAFVTHTRPALLSLRYQYRDFILWEQQQAEEIGNRDVGYWKKKLGGDLPVLELPTDHRRPPSRSFRGRRSFINIPTELVEDLERVSRKENATLFMSLFAIFNVLLMKYSRQMDLLVGTPVGGRLHSDFENLIGFFANTLVLRTDLSGNPTFTQLLKRVHETTLEAYQHQNVSFDQLVEELQPERELDRSPIFQVLFTLHNAPAPQNLDGIFQMSLVEFESSFSRFDLSVDIYSLPVGGGYRCEFEYSTDLFEEGTIRQMQGHYVRLLEEVVKDGERRIGELPLLSAGEREEVLQAWNQTSRGRAGYRTVAEWFGAQASETPDGIAVEMGDQALSYAELDAWSSRVAAGLRKRGIGREAVVGLYVSRSVEMVVCLLGIMKAGGAYLPLDPGYPSHRIAYLVKDSGVSLIVTEKSLLSSLPESGAQVVLLEEVLSAPEMERVEEAGSSEDLAYLIYTSGSTG
ncbi:condensation domain-containing protein, partial [Acidobacterium sp. S8]|uniref:non-ribosomal peptide synthetase n=1 Tax=Acidobacterium sp. S8 TaxID=1641854 RepID=UPI001C207FB8